MIRFKKSLQQKKLVSTKQLDISSVSVLIATLNEEEGIAPTIYEIQKEVGNPQILVIDGHSTDRTIDIAKDLGVEVFFQKKQGKGDAISEGLKHVNSGAKYVILTDADYTYPFRYVKQMIRILDSNPNIGVVLGDRFTQKYKNQSDRNQFYIGNRILGFLHWILNGVKLNDPFTGLRLIRRELLENWQPKAVGFDIEAEINDHIIKSGYTIFELPIRYRKRLGKKKLGFKHGLNILQRMILQGF